jgi:hypothetical protein
VGPGAAAVMQTIIDYNQKNPLATFKSHHWLLLVGNILRTSNGAWRVILYTCCIFGYKYVSNIIAMKAATTIFASSLTNWKKNDTYLPIWKFLMHKNG